MKEGITENIELLDSVISNAIETKLENINFLSQQINAGLYSEEGVSELNQLLRYYGDFYPEEVQLTYIGTTTGGFFSYPNFNMPADFDPREREWYQKAMENKGEVIITDPYVSAANDEMVVTISQSTADGSGVAAINISLAYIQSLVEQVKVGEKGYAMLLDKNSRFIYHPVHEAGSEGLAEGTLEKMYEKDSGEYDYHLKGEDRVMRFITNETTGWKIGGNLLSSEVSATAKPIFQKTFLIIAISIVVGTILVFFIIRSIVQPINILNKRAMAISQGDLSEPIEVTTNDEIGQLAKAMKTMQDTLRKMIDRIAGVSEQMANHSEELTQSANEVTTGTEQVSQTMDELASAAETQADNASELSAAMEGFATQLVEANNYNEEIYNSSKDVLSITEEGSQLMGESAQQMKKINEVEKIPLLKLKT